MCSSHPNVAGLGRVKPWLALTILLAASHPWLDLSKHSWQGVGSLLRTRPNREAFLPRGLFSLRARHPLADELLLFQSGVLINCRCGRSR